MFCHEFLFFGGWIVIGAGFPFVWARVGLLLVVFIGGGSTSCSTKGGKGMDGL